MTRKQRSQRETQAARVGIARAALFLRFTVHSSPFTVRSLPLALRCNATTNRKQRTVNGEQRTVNRPETRAPKSISTEWVRVSK
jgi:hypothetical protein